ncbi:hypothetical protein PIB30_047630 [Stylosanthes scabra]|uniref:Uncharacterized protein n=1 Tax=Stylosanthes scabra TaxID=79078 RepID=A0ABU6SHI1_9FABA|nr:hypothetical protein [Stylosanthes scabra]
MVVEMTQFGVDNGRMVLGCSMARRKSRVSIELGVQGRLIGPSGKYEGWLSSASSGSVGIGYDNRPGELTVACRIRHSSYASV